MQTNTQLWIASGLSALLVAGALGAGPPALAAAEGLPRTAAHAETALLGPPLTGRAPSAGESPANEQIDESDAQNGESDAQNGEEGPANDEPGTGAETGTDTNTGTDTDTDTGPGTGTGADTDTGAALDSDTETRADATAPVENGGEVADLATLKASVEALSPGQASFTLDHDFAPIGAQDTITLPAGVALTLVGAEGGTNITKLQGASGLHVRFVGARDQSLSLRNLSFFGHNQAAPSGAPGGESGGGVGVTGIGTVDVSDSTFAGIDGSSGLALSGVGTLSVTRSSFLGNRAGNSAAISMPTGISATITDSSFVKNHGTSSGYSGGAIRIQGASNLTIERSVFSDNLSTTRGGAIAFHQMDGSLTIRDSVFERNAVPLASNNSTLSDGGAIAVNERPIAGAQTGQTLISGSTFSNNIAGDEGGAILAQSGNGSSFVVENSTFFANTAQGLQAPFDNNSGGGAIEAFGTPATLLHNTFVNNIAERGTLLMGVAQRGGAVSAAGDSQHLKTQPLTMSHNLFVGNDTLDRNGASPANNAYRQVSAGAGIVTPGGAAEPDVHASNVGVDNGTAVDLATVNPLAVLGTASPAPAANGSGIIAGDPRTGHATTPGTIAIHPGDGELLTGLADGVATAASGISTDQRGFPVDEPADAGSLQQAFLRYDPNGGDWEAYTDSAFDGARAVQRDTEGVARVWAVGAIGSTVPTEQAPTTAPATPPAAPGLAFAGWNTAPDGSGTDFPAGGITVPAGNLRLYAQWEAAGPPVPPAEDGTVLVEYVDEAGVALRDPVTLTGPIGTEYTTEQLEVSGYTLARIEGDPSGVFSGDAAHVRYVYRLHQVSPPTYPKDEAGGLLSQSGTGQALAYLAGAAALIAAGAALLTRVGRRGSRSGG